MVPRVEIPLNWLTVGMELSCTKRGIGSPRLSPHPPPSRPTHSRNRWQNERAKIMMSFLRIADFPPDGLHDFSIYTEYFVRYS